MNLIEAILSGSVNDVEQALKRGDDPNQIDIYGFTPLIEAAVVNSVEKTQLLIKHGANPRDKDMTGSSPLHWASSNNNLELCKLLLDNGADPNAYTAAGVPILINPILRNQRELKELLYRYGADLKFAQDFINAKLIGHRFELADVVDIVNARGEFIDVDLEGFYLEFSVGIIQHSLERYRHHFSSRHLRGYAQYIHKMINAFVIAAELVKYLRYNIKIIDHEAFIDRLLSYDPLLIPVGYEGHAVTFIKCGKLFAKCDRGELSQRIPSVMIYDINNPVGLTRDFFKKLLYTRLSKSYVEHDFIEDLQLTPVMEFKLSSQISGNCSWSNVEGAVPTLLFMLLHKRKLLNHAQDIERNRQAAFTFYADWQEWDKDIALHECIESFYYSTPAGKASKAALLALVLFHGCHYDNPVHVARAQKIMRVLTEPEYEYVLKSYIKVYCQEARTEQGLRLLKLLEACGNNVY